MAAEDTYLILTENELTVFEKHDHYDDKTGKQYNYPNRYKNQIKTGVKFIYYRGTRTLTGNKNPEYFGTGIIGEIHRDPSVPQTDPERKWKWYCKIENYTPFEKPVYFMNKNSYYEKTSDKNVPWWNGVRRISKNVYEGILNAAGISDPEDYSNNLTLPRIEDTNAEYANDITGAMLLTKTGTNEKNGNSRQITRFAKEIGDRAERIIFEKLLNELKGNEKKTIVWRANQNETPGWD